MEGFAGTCVWLSILLKAVVANKLSHELVVVLFMWGDYEDGPTRLRAQPDVSGVAFFVAECLALVS